MDQARKRKRVIYQQQLMDQAKINSQEEQVQKLAHENEQQKQVIQKLSAELELVKKSKFSQTPSKVISKGKDDNEGIISQSYHISKEKFPNNKNSNIIQFKNSPITRKPRFDSKEKLPSLVLPDTKNSPTRRKPIFDSKEKLPSLVLPDTKTSYKEKLANGQKRAYNPLVRQYLNNFLSIANKFNSNPYFKMNSEEHLKRGYVTMPIKRINELIALPGCNPKYVKAAYDYGLLHAVYTQTGEELNQIPKIYEAAKNYQRVTKSTLIYVRCYTATGEVSYDSIRQAIRVIKMGVAQNYLNIPEDIKIQDSITIQELPELLREKRAVKLKSIYLALRNIAKTPFWVNFKGDNTLVMSSSREYGKGALETVDQWLWTLLLPEEEPMTRNIPISYLSQEAMKTYCGMIKQENHHKCGFCESNQLIVPTIEIFEDNELENNDEDYK